MMTLGWLLTIPITIVSMILRRWYSDGWQWWRTSVAGTIATFNESVALGAWVRSWAIPMYGQWDWQGRIISLVLRTGIIMIKSVQALVLRCVWCLLLVVYVLLPVVPFAFMLNALFLLRS